jgi:hypothetical protein
MDGFSAWLMAGGCTLYLIGGAVFRGVMGHGSPIPPSSAQSPRHLSPRPALADRRRWPWRSLPS